MADVFFDAERAERVIRFIETLRVPEGMHQGRPLQLREWQKDIIRQTYGPVDEVGRRLVRKAIYSVAKKNGKTPLVASIALAHLCGPEAKRNEQLYSAAFEREQASITFRYMRQMVEMDEELSDILTIKVSTKEIEHPGSGSSFKALSSETRGKHGLGPALIIFDELAQFGADRDFYDTLIQGRGAHEEPLLWIISTQADSDLAVLSEEIDYALRVQAGEIDDPTVKLFFFTAPAECGLTDMDAWRAANPALGDFLYEADMLEAARTAESMPSAENNFRNLRLNQRVSDTEHFLSQTIWQANGAKPDLEALAHGRIYAGLDLSGKNDLTALVLDAVCEDGHHIFPHFWTPGDNLIERADRDRVPYPAWVKQGHIEAKPGKTIDYGWVARRIAELHARYGFHELRFDRWRIEDMQRELADIGCDCYLKGKEDPPSGDALALVPHGQGFKDMNPAIEWVEDLIIEQRVRHGNHPVLTMCAANAVVQSDPAGNRKFAKDKCTGRIDGIVAMAMACNGAETPEIDETFVSVYETRGLRSL